MSRKGILWKLRGLVLASPVIAVSGACAAVSPLLPSDHSSPRIVEQPRDVTVAVGEPAIFEIVVSGRIDHPVHVLWHRESFTTGGQNIWVPVGEGFRFVLESPTLNDNGARFRAWAYVSPALATKSDVESREAVLTVVSTRQSVTFREDDFALGADWTLSSRFTGRGGNVDAQASPTGGNPGSFGRIIMIVNTVVPPSAGNVYGLFLKTSATYDPHALGAISAIDYSQDTKFMSGGGSGQATALLVGQGEAIYYAAFETTPEREWTRKFHQGLRAADFRLLNRDLSTSNFSPDFSATGLPLMFGFLRANSTGPNGAGYSTEVGMDNWLVTVNR
jgi:hypothetical protein